MLSFDHLDRITGACMSFAEKDAQLLTSVQDGSMRGVKAALKAGANVDGAPDQPMTPIAAATIADNAGLVVFLLGKGADPDRPVTAKIPCRGTGTVAPGERALHIATRSENVAIVRLLLKQSRADPNAIDNTGFTPLMLACSYPHACVEVVRLLLAAGADASLAQENGYTPLHAVALRGHIDVVDMLYSRAPATLNDHPANRVTPLYLACSEGHERMVSKLLSLGAKQPKSLDSKRLCPLLKAVEGGFVGAVQVLINEGGIQAVGGKTALAQALGVAITSKRVVILGLLLMADGEETRSAWASVKLGGRPLLHYGAGCCYPAAVSVLLEAGADEAALGSGGEISQGVIGVGLDRGIQMDRGRKLAIRRMLQRGAAYRARSWAWPSDEEAKDSGASSDGDTAAAADAAAAAAAAAAVLSSPPAVKTPSVAGVRIFRLKEKTSSTLFARLIGRYCAKD